MSANVFQYAGRAYFKGRYAFKVREFEFPAVAQHLDVAGPSDDADDAVVTTIGCPWRALKSKRT